jgi:hypothetical protein
MRPILQGITNLKQHKAKVLSDPDAYRPDRCPYCSKEGLWHYGRYFRQSDREQVSRDSLNPVPILRFLLSFLPHIMFYITRMPCTETMVSMAYSASCSGDGLEE